MTAGRPCWKPRSPAPSARTNAPGARLTPPRCSASRNSAGRPPSRRPAAPCRPVSPGWRIPSPAAASPATPGRPQGVALPSDPVARDIAAQLAAIDDQNASRMLGTVGGRARSGTSGLDRLQEISGSLQASVAPGVIGGRLSATISPVTIDAGKLGSRHRDPQPLRQQPGQQQARHQRHDRFRRRAGAGLHRLRLAEGRYRHHAASASTAPISSAASSSPPRSATICASASPSSAAPSPTACSPGPACATRCRAATGAA